MLSWRLILHNRLSRYDFLNSQESYEKYLIRVGILYELYECGLREQDDFSKVLRQFSIRFKKRV